MTSEVVGSCPLDCPDTCSWVVTVEEGKATRLRGNPDHPFTRGGLCKKVNPWLEMAADPDRLLTPFRRVAVKGVRDRADRMAAFEPISWDEALGQIADRFNRIIAEDGPAAIWPFWGTGNLGFLQGSGGPAGGRLWKHLGVSGHQVTICSTTGHLALNYTIGTGTGLDPTDVVLADLVVIWGSNTLVTNQHWWPFVEQARANGAPVVVIDPVRTRTARRADHWIAPRPGTDGALALGLARELIERGAHDPAFIEDRTTGFGPFAQLADQWTLDRTARECGIDRTDLELVVDLLAHSTAATIKLAPGMQRTASGGRAARAISCLPALLGHYGRAGGGLVYSASDPTKLNASRARGSHIDGFGHRAPRMLVMTNLAANLNTLDDPPIKALFVYGANPVVSNPNSNAVRQAMSRADLFTVVTDLYPTPTIDFADIVLPSAMQHEQWELNNAYGHLYLNLNQPAVEPAGQCLAHTEIFRRLARAMDLDHPALYASDTELLEELLHTPDSQAANITLDRLRREGFVRVPGTEAPYRPLADTFPTPSGRFEFASQRAEVAGYPALPHYAPPVETAGDPDPGYYDLVANGSDWFINTVFAGTAVTARRASQPAVVINSQDGERDGLIAGELVEVGNQRGTFTAVVQFDPEARRGLATTTKGWWDMGINDTVAERDSDMGRGATFHDNRVHIHPTP